MNSSTASIDHQFCLTGAAFNFLFDDVSPLTEEHKVLLLQCKVFVRTKPLDKAKVVMAYRQMSRKTSMCGDGVNDSRVLKQAVFIWNLGLISALFSPNCQALSQWLDCWRNVGQDWLAIWSIQHYSYVWLHSILNLHDPPILLHLPFWIDLHVLNGCLSFFIVVLTADSLS